MAEEKDDKSKELSLKDAAKDSITAVAKEVYADGLKPAVSRLGNALGTLASVVDIALSPIELLMLAGDLKRQQFRGRIRKVLEVREVPEDRVEPPSATIAGPVLQAMLWSEDNPELADMYAALLASAMDRDTARKAHPAFVEVLRQITSDEVKIIQLFGQAKEFPVWLSKLSIHRQESPRGPGYFEEATYVDNLYLVGHDAGCKHLDLVPSYADNLCRLGLTYLTNKEIDKHVQNLSDFDLFSKSGRFHEIPGTYPDIASAIKDKTIFGGDPSNSLTFYLRHLRVTAFGRQFYDACIATSPNPDQDNT